MLNKKLFKRTFAVLFLVGFLMVVGDALYFNWTIWWYDILLHFLGGSLVAMSFILFWNFLGWSMVNKNTVVLVSVFMALIVGIVWEIYELYFDMTSFSDGAYFVFDTTKDLVVDMCGGVLASVYSIKIISRNN